MGIQVASSSGSNATFPETTSMRSMKRKLDDAFSILDDAVGSHEQPAVPPPTKKTATSRSFYSTLAKYGIKSKPKEAPVIPDRTDSIKGLSKPTPHLTAILHRAATRTRKALPSFKSPSSISTASAGAPISSAPSGVEYRPSSTASFLSRLATFKLATYANKPASIDAVAASKCGWINDGKDRLLCGICRASWVVVGREGMSRDAGNTLVEKQRQSLVQSHKDGCPWKKRQCDDSIYRIQLKPPVSMAQELKSTALSLESVLEGVEIKHPLTLAQVNSLRTAVSFVTLPPSLSDLNLVPPNNENATESSPPPLEPSETALLTSLFGWTVAPQTTTDRFISYGSISRVTSRLPSRSGTPSLSRATSIQLSTPRTVPRSTPSASPSISPAKSTSISTAGIAPSSRRLSRTTPTDKQSKNDSALLHCQLCQRRVGLWAFASCNTSTTQPTSTSTDADASASPAEKSDPSPTHATTPSKPPRRQFDLLKEHRSYCPYVIKSTIVPALPVPLPSNEGSQSNDSSRYNFSLYSLSSQALTAAGVNNAMEGWRAVFTIVLRYGLSQRQRKLGRSPTVGGSTETVDVDMADVGGVEAMVEGVKRRGGRDLLRYVKGLLG